MEHKASEEQASVKTGNDASGARTRRVVSIVSIVIYVALIVCVAVFVGKPLVQTLGDPERFRAWVEGHGAFGELALIGVMALQVIVAILPAEPFEIAAGYAFGAFQGSLLVWLGLNIGTLIVFLFVRRFGVKVTEAFFPREKIDQNPLLGNEKRLNIAAFVLFLIPGSPKDLLSYCAGLTRIKLLPWMALTATARIPSIVTSTIGGNALGEERYGFAIIVFAATAVFSTACVLIYRAVSRRRALREVAKEDAERML